MEQERNTMEVAFTRCDRAVANPEVMEKIGDILVGCVAANHPERILARWWDGQVPFPRVSLGGV
jgi:hypothetical protein